MDASALVRNFIQAMEQRNAGGQSAPPERLFTTLADLLTPAVTMPLIDSADTDFVDRLLQCLPEQLIALAEKTVNLSTLHDPELSAEGQEASTKALLNAKKDLLRRVLRSPQFSQSLASLTVALREGGLPTISEALDIPVRHGGYLRHGGVPMGGGAAVEAFLEGVKDKVMEKEDEGGEKMDTE